MLHSLRIASIVGFATFASALAIDDSRNAVLAANAFVTGYVQVQVNLTATSSLPNGTLVNLNVFIAPEDNILYAYSSVGSSAKIAGGKVTATITVPYRWLVSNASEKISASVYASASGPGNNIYDTSSLTQEFAIPANGKVTTVPFSGTI